MIHISISTLYKKNVTKESLSDAAISTLEYEKIDPEINDISILVRNDPFIRKLKKQYFGIDEATDVLSFPAGDSDPESGHIYLGDIVISFPQAENNALAANKSTRSEISLLVVHGVLHLLGYDHADEESQKNMWAKQEMILNKLEGKKKDG